MRTAAIYRLLYGSDFIAQSIESVYDHVDHVLCFVTREAFGGRRVIRYFGRDVYLPHDIDGVADTIRAWADEYDYDSKVEIIDNPFGARLLGQVSSMLNEIVLPRFDLTHVLFVECDEVWHPDHLDGLLELARVSDADEFMAHTCHLFWKSPRFVSTRTNPYAVLRALKGRGRIGETAHALSERDQSLKRARDPRVVVHNFGYAGSERTMFWKHLTGLSFSRDMRLDSPPREEWFEDVWRPWHWDRNRREDLCPSIGHERAFAPAEEYPFDDLPPIMQRTVEQSPLPEWLEQGGLPCPTSPTLSSSPRAA